MLYTSQAKEGATEEMRFHLMRGQPVMPSKTRYKLFEICLVFQRVLKFVDLAALQKLGLKSAGYGQLSYQEKQAEHPRYQEIGEMAYFLGYDGLLVPSTRHRSMNVIIFCDRVPPQDTTVKKDYRKVNWN